MNLLAIAWIALVMRCNPLTEWGYRDHSDYVRLAVWLMRGCRKTFNKDKS